MPAAFRAAPAPVLRLKSFPAELVKGFPLRVTSPGLALILFRAPEVFPKKALLLIVFAPLGIVVVELIPKPELDTKILFKMKTEKLWLVIEMPSPPLFTAIAPTM